MSVIASSGFAFGRDAGDLANLLRKLVDDPNCVMSTGRRARWRAESTYQWDLVIAQHYELFRRVCDVRR
jgi:hypothetical protein